MGEVRMSLADAAKALGIAPNSVRSRFKAGKIRGERDNQGKLWVWLDPTQGGLKPTTLATVVEGSKPDRSKPSKDDSNKAHIEALEAHLRTLTDQLDRSQTEVSALRDRASIADRLEAQIEALETLRDEVRADRDHWRNVAEQALQSLRDEPEPRPSLWNRLFGRY